MRYQCQRCKAECFTTDPPHLCADLRKRYDRQQKAVAIVTELLAVADPGGRGWHDEAALEIVRALSGRDLGD